MQQKVVQSIGSGEVMLDRCLIYGNSPNDIYIDDYGRLLLNSTIDDLKGLYETNNLILQGVFDDSDAELDISNMLTGEKGIVFRWKEIKESEQTEEVNPTPTPAPSTGTNIGNTSTDIPSTNNYSSNYTPTIYNNVAVPAQKKKRM